MDRIESEENTASEIVTCRSAGKQIRSRLSGHVSDRSTAPTAHQSKGNGNEIILYQEEWNEIHAVAWKTIILF